MALRATRFLSKGTKSYGWYSMYAEGGQDAFKKTKPPSAYDWTGMAPATPRPKAYFDIQIDGEKTGKLEFELASEVVPETVANFTRLCKGQGIKYPGYKDTNVHLLRKGQLFMGGDIEKKDGTGSYSSYESRYIPDENHVIAHTDRGILSMASAGLDTGASQFIVTLKESPQLNGRCVAFGRLVNGEETLKAIEEVYTVRSAPARTITIADCGLVEE